MPGSAAWNCHGIVAWPATISPSARTGSSIGPMNWSLAGNNEPGHRDRFGIGNRRLRTGASGSLTLHHGPRNEPARRTVFVSPSRKPFCHNRDQQRRWHSCPQFDRECAVCGRCAHDRVGWAGQHREAAPPGEYHWVGLHRADLHAVYRGSFQSGTPPWLYDKTGGWTADHSAAGTVVAVGERMLLVSFSPSGVTG